MFPEVSLPLAPPRKTHASLCPWKKVCDTKTAFTQYHLKQDDWTEFQAKPWVTDRWLSLWTVTAADGGGFFRIITIVLFFSSSFMNIVIITLEIKKFRIKEIEGESSCWVINESYVNCRARTLWYNPVRIYIDPLFRCQVTPVYLGHIRMLFELLSLLHFNIPWQRTASAYKSSHLKLFRK